MADENMETPAPKEGLGKGAIIAIVAIGAIVVLGAGYAIGKYSTSKTSEEAVTTETPPVPDEPTTVASTTTTATATTTTSATDETASWKTYTNSQYGFSFKYPATYTAENADDGVQINITSDINQIPIFEVTTQQSSLTLQKFIDDKTNNLTFADTSATTFAGLAAYEGVDQGMVSSYGIITKNSIGIIELTCSANNTDKLSDIKASITNIQKQILSTFQFTK